MQRSMEVSAFAGRLDGDITRRLAQEGVTEPLGSTASVEPEVVDLLENITTECMLTSLNDVGAIDDVHIRFAELRAGPGAGVARVNGYRISEEEDRLDLVVTLSRPGGQVADVPAQEVQRAVDQAWRFFWACRKQVPAQFDPLDEAHGMAQRMLDVQGPLTQVQIFVLVQGLAGEFRGGKSHRVRYDGPLDVRVHIWDLERLARCVESGRPRESIEVDFVEDFGKALPCLPIQMGTSAGAYLAVIPGDVLHRLYDEYGERLLELNVRSFLQARGSVNRGIRDSILEEPERFFAYNNGLSAIAEEVRTARSSDGSVRITGVRGLQIVNGGQTTASIHRAASRDKADLSQVFVQAKLTVVPAAQVEEMVPRISLFANSQNKVNEADFTANDPFHLALEKLSRTVWTPDQKTHWFYERARGQYQVARSRLTGVQAKEFDRVNPADQLFTKTDVSTFVHSWAGLPHTVSLGAQKNFREFTLQMQRGPAIEPDEPYFKELIAKAIIFRSAQQAAREARVSAYKANIVAYSVAYLAAHAGQQIDLEEVWAEQRVPDHLRSALLGLIGPIETAIKRGADGRNVTEWCKKEECWKKVKQLQLTLPREMGASSSRAKRPVATSAAERLQAAAKAGANMRTAQVKGTAPGVAEGSGDQRAQWLSAAAVKLASKGHEVIDKRPSGGALWVVGSHDLAADMDGLRLKGLMPVYCAEGSRATEGRPAWYIRARA